MLAIQPSPLRLSKPCNIPKFVMTKAKILCTSFCLEGVNIDITLTDIVCNMSLKLNYLFQLSLALINIYNI